MTKLSRMFFAAALFTYTSRVYIMTRLQIFDLFIAASRLNIIAIQNVTAGIADPSVFDIPQICQVTPILPVNIQLLLEIIICMFCMFSEELATKPNW